MLFHPLMMQIMTEATSTSGHLKQDVAAHVEKELGAGAKTEKKSGEK
jgi:hypothetical protein